MIYASSSPRSSKKAHAPSPKRELVFQSCTYLKALCLAGTCPPQHGCTYRSYTEAHLYQSSNRGKGIVVGRGGANNSINLGGIATSTGQRFLGRDDRHINQ